MSNLRPLNPSSGNRESASSASSVGPAERAIVVGGCHRSGTSLVRRILNAHSRIYCGPEVKFFRDFYSDYLHDSIRHDRFFLSARAILPEDDLLAVFGRAYLDVQETAAKRAGKARWADKNPENVLYLDAWTQLLGDEWVFIQVTRNPLDTLASIKEVQFPQSIPPGLDDRIAFYRRYTQAGLDFGQAHPHRSYRLVYERLVREPIEAIQQLMSWLGEPFETGQINFNDYPHQFGLEDPKVGNTSEVHGQSVGRWASAFTPAEARHIWDQTADLWAIVDPEAPPPW